MLPRPAGVSISNMFFCKHDLTVGTVNVKFRQGPQDTILFMRALETGIPLLIHTYYGVMHQFARTAKITLYKIPKGLSSNNLDVTLWTSLLNMTVEVAATPPWPATWHQTYLYMYSIVFYVKR